MLEKELVMKQRLVDNLVLVQVPSNFVAQLSSIMQSTSTKLR